MLHLRNGSVNFAKCDRTQNKSNKLFKTTNGSKQNENEETVYCDFGDGCYVSGNDVYLCLCNRNHEGKRNSSIKGVGHITFKARSDNSSGSVNMCLSPYSSIDMGDTMGITTYVKVPTNDTEVKPEETVETEKTWYVHYEFKDGNPKGTFLMCWIYG